MIYVSSSCVRTKTIKETVLKLIENGFFNIELSSGTEYYDGLEDDLLELKDRYKINFILHNYFPPPKKHFVINLASLNGSVYNRSAECLIKSLDLCKKLEVNKFGFHAGFFVDIEVSELGRETSRRKVYDKNKALVSFCRGFAKLKEHADGIKLYIENNVFSPSVRKNYLVDNPFLLVHYNNYLELKKRIDFNLLIDVAHLNVTSNTLGLSFPKQLKSLMPYTDYLHLSDVGKVSQQHKPFRVGSRLLRSLRGFDLVAKTITLEIYGGMDELKRSHRIVREMLL